MTTTVSDVFGDLREDPLYLEGMAHLQRAEWDEAIASFENLVAKYPDSQEAKRVLEEARLRAEIGASKHVRGRKITVQVWPWLLRLALLALVGYLLYTGGQLLVSRVQPLIREAKTQQELEQLLSEAEAYYAGGDMEAAEARFKAVLERDPLNARAQQVLAEIEEARQIDALYAEAVALDEAGDDEAALAAYQKLSQLRPGYRDVQQRMTAIERAKSVAHLYAEASAAYEAGDAEDAIAKYEALRDVNISYQREIVEKRLFELYMSQGRAIIDERPPRLERLETALTYFSKALALRQHSDEAGRERQLLKLFLEGQAAFYEERWTEAAAKLRMVYDIRPDYLGDTVLNLLYDAYVHSGDAYREAGDVYLAYEQYRKALELPVEDKAFAQGRLFYVEPYLTPTATPTPTPTPRPAYVGPPPTPRPLSAYKGKIVFLADYPNRGEIWVMDPDGQNRQRLGRNWELREQFEALEDRERYSPDGRRFAFVQNPSPTEAAPQVFLTLPQDQRVDGRWYVQLTHLDAICYDPVWSPDGTRIAFVTPAIESDDIWVINVDGSNAVPLTPNPWEWDRHPSWSPDSQQIVFWSNRSGLMQLYIMNADGTEVTNISNTQWDEYDPIWIK